MRLFDPDETHSPKSSKVDVRKHRVGTKQLASQGRCYICFSTRHRTKECNSDKKCIHCSKACLCRVKYGKTEEFPTKQAVNLAQMQQLNPEAPEFFPASVVYAASRQPGDVGHAGKSILESAVVTIAGSKGRTKARIVFDTGSAMSFGKSSVLQQVGAESKGQSTTELGRFGDAHRVHQTYNLREIKLVLNNGESFPLKLKQVDQLSTPISLFSLDLSAFANLR